MPAHNHGPLPRYSLGDDEKTRPCVVVFDWSDEDDAQFIRVVPVERNAAVPPPLPPRGSAATGKLDEVMEVDDVEELEDVEELDDYVVRTFRPRSHGIGRRPGAVALAIVLCVSFTIGAFAIFGSQEAQAEPVTDYSHWGYTNPW
jgi:hypothetical protein